MSKPEDRYKGEPSCGQPMEAHFGALMGVVLMAGASFDCNGVYHALVEVAEAFRIAGGFKTYQPDADGIGAQTAIEIKMRLAERDAQQATQTRARQASDGLPVLDAEFTTEETRELQAGYDRLTPEQKKKFN